jgi:hypothetical protein
MAKTYRISSETINFSLVVPDHVPEQEVMKEASLAGEQIAQQQYKALQSGQWSKAFIALVDEAEEEEDVSTLLGRLCADYYRNS